MKNSGEVRIVGGQWRRRRLRFPAVPGLRPSPDRVRETLFNWLMGRIEGRRCLDLYCGSGAFGFEAASRGAQQVVMVDSSAAVVRGLEHNRELLAAGDRLDIVRDDVPRFLGAGESRFDVVFMDPPFDGDAIPATCAALVDHRRLAPGALVYIESMGSKTPLPIPPGWHIIRESRHGAVQSTLLQS